MILQPTSDQEFFRETTAKFLDDTSPVAELRRRRDDSETFSSDYWRRGAELGWTSLLVEEKHGGGSISGNGIIDLTLVAYEFGRHAAPGPLIPTNVVAGALSHAGSHEDVLAEILAGTTIATWCNAGDTVGVELDGDSIVINGMARPVESADRARNLLVTGRTKDGLTQALIPTDTLGISIEAMQTVDLSKRFSVVTFDNARIPASALVGHVGEASEALTRQRHHALVMLNAESVGAMHMAFDMTLQWAFDRYSFGRPLASYQALKHRFADMKVWVEASHAISDEAAEAVSAGAANADELLSAAKAFIGHYGGILMQDCVQLHGGIGVTFEHDLHLYFRRHTVNTPLYGTPTQHRLHLTDLIEQGEASL